MSLFIKNIKQLVQVEDAPRRSVPGEEMKSLRVIDNAWVYIEGERIHSFGSMRELNGPRSPFFKKQPDPQMTEINAAGKLVFPCWCDPHTHIVFAGSREGEFVDKIKGLSYEEIARRGGGILNSAKKLQETSEDDLFTQSFARLKEITSYGTGAVEIKSGYGLTVNDELKMLRVIKRMKELSHVTIKSTFLGAHAIPTEYKENRQKYIDIITREMIPAVAEEKLADYCDVFCDKGFFTVKETEEILIAAEAVGLRPKIHANELDYSGGIQLGVKHRALSVDHLEFTGEAEIDALLGSETMPTLLPSTAFFLGLHYPPARKMIDAGLAVALATDYNPGSSPSGRMSFILSLACIKMKMLPEEAINAATINAAYAMGVESELGSIAVGKKANLFITKPVPSLAYLPYSFGSDMTETVIINGKVTK